MKTKILLLLFALAALAGCASDDLMPPAMRYQDEGGATQTTP